MPKNPIKVLQEKNILPEKASDLVRSHTRSRFLSNCVVIKFKNKGHEQKFKLNLVREKNLTSSEKARLEAIKNDIMCKPVGSVTILSNQVTIGDGDWSVCLAAHHHSTLLAGLDMIMHNWRFYFEVGGYIYYDYWAKKGHRTTKSAFSDRRGGISHSGLMQGTGAAQARQEMSEHQHMYILTTRNLAHYATGLVAQVPPNFAFTAPQLRTAFWAWKKGDGLGGGDGGGDFALEGVQEFLGAGGELIGVGLEVLSSVGGSLA